MWDALFVGSECGLYSSGLSLISDYGVGQSENSGHRTSRVLCNVIDPGASLDN